MKSILDFARRKAEGLPISMVTCYDAWSARIIAGSPIDAVLVGDSASMVVHGETSTLAATVDQMADHVKAVRRGGPSLLIIGDLPFMSYRKGLQPAMEAVEALMRAGANAVKLEGADGNLELVRHIVETGVPVMGHLGLVPQSVNALGGYRVQGRLEKDAAKIQSDARALEAAGAFSLVLECIPEDTADELTAALSIPTIGIGSGSRTSGQILVLQDMLGLSGSFSPVFVRKYLDGMKLIGQALEEYDADVKSKAFPSLDESYLR